MKHQFHLYMIQKWRVSKSHMFPSFDIFILFVRWQSFKASLKLYVLKQLALLDAVGLLSIYEAMS